MNNHPVCSQSTWWRWYGLWHRRRIRHVVIVQIILAQGEWSSAKDVGPILERCNTRQQQTFCDMGNVYVFDMRSICIHSEELLRQLAFHQKYRRSHNETDVRHNWEIDNRTIRPDLWNEYISVGTLFTEVFVFDWWWRSHQSLACGDLRIFRFCIVPWKDEREPTIKLCMGRQVGMVQNFSGIQRLGQNWWWVNGLRVEYFPGFNTLQLDDEV